MSDRKTFSVFTTGCKANQCDSQVIAERLEAAGLTRAPAESADFIVVNACCLTSRAEADARRFIGRARRQNAHALVALVGCQGQAYPGRDFGADLVLGQTEKFEIDSYLTERGRFVAPGRAFPMEATAPAGAMKGRTRFFFKIQDGCNRFCSYCIVPYARGAARSRPAPDVAATMEALARKGVKEVVLTGIDIASWRDPASGKGLKELLLSCAALDTPPRIRLSSVDPLYIDDALADIMACSPKIAKSIHVPAQSGSDRILKAMGRPYGGAYLRRTVERLRERVPAIGIGMDFMVGFPGEDEEAFEETRALVESLDVSYLHVFPYSEREGTAAAGFDGKVPQAARIERARRLKALDAQKRAAFASRFLGERVCIIPEGKMYRGRFMRGFSDNYLPIYIPYEKRLENNLVEVTITDIQDSRLIRGSICS